MRKTGATLPKDIDEYLARLPEPGRTTLSKLRATIRSVVPGDTTEAFSYGMPAFKYKGPLVAYAAFSDHCSFFPMDPKVIESLESELAKYETSKGTIKFASDNPLPASLVKKIVKLRVAANEARKSR